MPRREASIGLAWILGTIQYGVCLTFGGAAWLIFAHSTGFFWGDLPAQLWAGAVLLLLIVAESWWAHMPEAGNELLDYVVDFLTSALLVGFGMGVVEFISLWLPQ